MLRNIIEKNFYISAVLLTIFIVGCQNNPFGDSDTPAQKESYNPLKILKLQEHVDRFGKVMASDDNYIVIGSDEGRDGDTVFLYDKTNPSTLPIATITPQDENISLLSLAVADQYLAIGNARSNTNYSSYGNILLYKIDTNNTFKKLSTIIPQDTQDQWNYFGTKIVLNNNYILVSTRENTAYLFKINSDDTVTQLAKITIPQQDALSYYEFASDIAMDGDTIAIGAYTREKGEIIYLYHRNTDGSVTLIDSLDFPYRGNFNKHFALKDSYLATTENYNNILHIYKVTNTEIINIAQKTVDLSEIYHRNYTFIDSGHIYAVSNDNGNLGISIFTIDNDVITKTADIPFDTFSLPTDITTISLSNNNVLISYPLSVTRGNVLWYNLNAKNQIYIYTTPPQYFDIGEGELFNYSIDAASPVGPISYSLDGDDASYFTNDENNITNSVVFDYEHPIDSNVDNNYSFTLNLQDPDNNKKTIPFSVIVHDKKYIKKASLITDSRTYSMASYNNYLLLGLARINRVDIYKEENGVLNKVSEIVADANESSSWFGTSVAIYGDTILIGASRSNYGDGAVFLYKFNPSDYSTTLVKKISFDSKMQFGKAVALTQDKFCVGFNQRTGRDHYFDGGIALFQYNDTNFTQLSEYNQTTNTYNFYSNVYKITMTDEYIVARGLYSMHVYSIDTNGSIVEVAQFENKDDIKDIDLESNKVITTSDTNITLYTIESNNTLQQRDTYLFDQRNYIRYDSLDFSNNTITFCQNNHDHIFHIDDNNTITYVDDLNKYDTTWYCNLTNILPDGNITATQLYENKILFYEKDID